jgi:hypothetical protein
MVGKDTGKIGSAEVPETRANGLESRVRRRKNGNVAKVVHGVHEVGAGKGAGQ